MVEINRQCQVVIRMDVTEFVDTLDSIRQQFIDMQRRKRRPSVDLQRRRVLSRRLRAKRARVVT